MSRSIDQQKFLLQRQGYAAAISDPLVMDAIKSGPHQRIAVSFVEWSGFGAQKLVIDWTIIDGPGAARKFGNQLLNSPRAFADRTSISGGIEFAAAQLERARFEGANRTIDISGDGTNNAGRDVTLARDATVTKGITINGLVILSHRPTPPWPPEHTNPPGGLEKYYQDNVIGGPGAFVLVAENFEFVRPRHHQEAGRRDRPALGATHRHALRHVAALRTVVSCYPRLNGAAVEVYGSCFAWRVERLSCRQAV